MLASVYETALLKGVPVGASSLSNFKHSDGCFIQTIYSAYRKKNRAHNEAPESLLNLINNRSLIKTDQTLSRSNRQHALGTIVCGFVRPQCGAIQGMTATGNQSMLPKSIFLVAAFLQAALLGPTSPDDSKSVECGLASVYSTDSEETASGEDTQPENFTAAHRSLPFGTLVHVNNQENGHSAIVRITDRGPFTSGRIIDLSKNAARELRFPV